LFLSAAASAASASGASGASGTAASSVATENANASDKQWEHELWNVDPAGAAFDFGF
jgi:hypothetical protein